MSNLFESSLNPELQPLAERLRPKQVHELIGQDHVIGETKPLGKLLRLGRLINLIITGPPGTGKTTFAKALAQTAKANYLSLNAVDSGVKDLKQAGEFGRNKLYENSEKTVLFVDEIHRFNKSQQDVLLPFLEKGELYLVGATTEHPSYELNKALISRCQIIQFKKLEKDNFLNLLKRVEKHESIVGSQIVDQDALSLLIQHADGDGRRFLNLFETLLELYKVNSSDFPYGLSQVNELYSHKVFSYDKNSDQHYDSISAFIKSIRGSDPDAALYYMARMLAGGEDPVFIARRLVVLASEDIGNAEPRALPLAMAGLQAVEAIGLPECAINLAQVVIFLASSVKSNRSYQAWNRAKEFVEVTGAAEVPDLLKSSFKGNGLYQYPHDFEKAFTSQNHWPSAIKPQKFYEPSGRGHEKIIAEYYKWIKSNT